MDEADVEVIEEPNDIAAVSGPNHNAKVNKKKRARQPTAGVMPTFPCPLCKVELKSKFVVKRHMKLKHKLSKKSIDQYQIATTTRRCEHCGRDLKNIYDRRHKGLINAAKQQTAENAAAAQEKGVLEFNPVRLAAVTIHILEHELVSRGPEK